jgi:hypothetical protein
VTERRAVLDEQLDVVSLALQARLSVELGEAEDAIRTRHARLVEAVGRLRPDDLVAAATVRPGDDEAGACGKCGWPTDRPSRRCVSCARKNEAAE